MKNDGKQEMSKDDVRRVLRYCYDPDKLYGQLRNHTRNYSMARVNVCPILFNDDKCKTMSDKWSDGVKYPNNVHVSTEAEVKEDS